MRSQKYPVIVHCTIAPFSRKLLTSPITCMGYEGLCDAIKCAIYSTPLTLALFRLREIEFV